MSLTSLHSKLYLLTCTPFFPIFPLGLSKAEVWEPFPVTLAFLLRLNVLAFFFPLTASLLICHDYCWIFQLSFPNVNQWLSTSPLSYVHSKQPFPSKWGFLPFHPLKGPVFWRSQSFVRSLHLSFFQSAPDTRIQPGLQPHNHCSSFFSPCNLFMHGVFCNPSWPVLHFSVPFYPQVSYLLKKNTGFTRVKERDCMWKVQ